MIEKEVWKCNRKMTGLGDEVRILMNNNDAKELQKRKYWLTMVNKALERNG